MFEAKRMDNKSLYNKLKEEKNSSLNKVSNLNNKDFNVGYKVNANKVNNNSLEKNKNLNIANNVEEVALTYDSKNIVNTSNENKSRVVSDFIEDKVEVKVLNDTYENLNTDNFSAESLKKKDKTSQLYQKYKNYTKTYFN
jgi:hypothetical protein